MNARLLLPLMVLGVVCHAAPLYAGASPRHRLIVLTDIEAEPDDTESMVRLLLYSNEIDIEGLIATTSCWKQWGVAPDAIRKVIQAYGKVQPNLRKHDPGFPDAELLLAKVKQGIAKYGMDGVGEGKDSEGSAWIIQALEKADGRPLWVSVWGGANTLAQALYRLGKDRPEAEARPLMAKLRVYAISDQDDSGSWIRKTFPGVFYIVSPGDDYGSATWSAINTVVDGIDNRAISNAWLARNIQQGHGPLGAAYPDVAYGMEGDTPSWLALIPNGLNVPEHPEWGGWGGRYELAQRDVSTVKKGGSIVPVEPETRAIWTDTTDAYTPYAAGEYGRAVKPASQAFRGNKVSLWRWRDEFQNDFAARMDWCLKPFAEANHPPVVRLTHPATLNVKSGDGFGMDGGDSTDPDGDALSYLWVQYPEAGTYKKAIRLESAENTHGFYVKAPEVEKEETLHFVLKVTDKGEPPLTRYQRVVVTVQPK